MADELLRIFRGPLTASLSTTLYTVPADTKVALRHIHVSNTGGTTIPLTLRISGYDLLSAFPVGATGVMTVDTNQVMYAGEVLSGGGAATGLHAHISGVAETPDAD